MKTSVILTQWEISMCSKSNYHLFLSLLSFILVKYWIDLRCQLPLFVSYSSRNGRLIKKTNVSARDKRPMRDRKIISIYICLTVRFRMLVDWFFLPYSLHLSISQIALPWVQIIKEIRTSILYSSVCTT